MSQETTMAAVILMTITPTDRALAGWCVFGEGYDWDEYVTRPGDTIMNLVSGYVWT